MSWTPYSFPHAGTEAEKEMRQQAEANITAGGWKRDPKPDPKPQEADPKE